MVRSTLRLMWFWSVKLEVWNFTRNILRSFGWTNAEIFCCLAGPGEEGSIQQIAGPREDYASKFVQDKRGKSRAISELERGKAISRKEFCCVLQGIFSSQEPQNLETMKHAGWLQQERVFVMSTMKMQVNHMQSQENGLPPCFYECFARRVVTVSDANKMAHQRQGQQPNCS